MKESLLRIGLALGITGTLATAGLIQSQESECIDGVRFKDNVSVCNTEEGVQIQGWDGSTVVLPYICDSSDVYVSSERIVRAYRQEFMHMVVFTVDLPRELVFRTDYEAPIPIEEC